MHGCRLASLLLAAQALAAGGCCCGLPTPWASTAAPYATHVAGQAYDPSPAAPASEQPGQVMRSQSPPDDTGLFTIPGWDSIKDSAWVNSAKKLVGRDRNEPKARRLFAEAEKQFEAKEYDEAADNYKAAARHFPDTELEEDALFMLGECYFFGDKYPAASDAYGELLAKYENSRHLDKVVQRQFAVARYWADLQRANPRWVLNPNVIDRTRPTWDTAGNAIKAYESVRMHDPTGPLADDSIMATANEHFLGDKFDDADYFYGLLRSDYPKSEHLMQAYLLGLRSKLRKYKGPRYDSAALAEAERLIDEMLTQFPHELDRDELQRVKQAKVAVEAQLAERDWEMGEFYYKTKHYRAAGYYYESVVKEFPETKFAELARERLVETKDLPPEPPQRLKWLSNLFPGESKRRR